MVRFPHVLSFTVDAEPVFENGEWTVPENGNSEINIPCRAQPNVRSSYITNEEDGQRIEFACTVYIARGNQALKTGQSVIIKSNGNQIYSGTVKRYHPGQLHDRLWV